MQSKKWNLTKDYFVISKWCKAHKWDLAIPKEMLPPLGIIISEQEDICAAGLYIDKKAKFGFMYGIFSNPKTSKIKLNQIFINVRINDDDINNIIYPYQ